MVRYEYDNLERIISCMENDLDYDMFDAMRDLWLLSEQLGTMDRETTYEWSLECNWSDEEEGDEWENFKNFDEEPSEQTINNYIDNYIAHHSKYASPMQEFRLVKLETNKTILRKIRR